MSSEHPFKTGVEVAISISGNWFTPRRFKKSVVTKLLPNGKFRVEESDAQWRAYGPSNFENYWHANAAGSHGGYLVIFDNTTAEMVNKANARFNCHRRFSNVKYEIDRCAFSDNVTENVLQHLESALSLLQVTK